MTVAALLGAAAAAGQVAGVHVSTRESVDCSSLKSIVRDVCARKGCNQEKAISLFDFARRLMFAWPNRVDPVARHDTLHLLNTYGYSFCSQQALLTVHVWQAAGIKGQVWSVPGHSTMQAQYGGGRHWFDLLIGAYVYRWTARAKTPIRACAAGASRPPPASSRPSWGQCRASTRLGRPPGNVER